jgi:hypothetical protein
MTPIAHGMARRARWAALCVALALGVVPAEATASAARWAAVVAWSPATRRVDVRASAAPRTERSARSRPARPDRSPLRAPRPAAAREHGASRTPPFVAHRALLR